jgi:hypothetical protein
MMSQNTFHNTGDFRGAAVFQGSTINNAGQIAGMLANADATSKEALKSLVAQLGEVLKNTPPEEMDDANAAASAAEDLVTEAARSKPNKSRLRLLGEGLVSGVKAVGSAAPAAISIAQNIVDLIGKISGLG